MTNRSRFRNFGNGAVFKCNTCGRSCRVVDQGSAGCCSECFEIAGIDNYVNDNGLKPGDAEHTNSLAECNALLEAIVKKGGNAEAVKNSNSYIWR